MYLFSSFIENEQQNFVLDKCIVMFYTIYMYIYIERPICKMHFKIIMKREKRRMNILPIGTVVRLKNGTQKIQFAKNFLSYQMEIITANDSIGFRVNKTMVGAPMA